MTGRRARLPLGIFSVLRRFAPLPALVIAAGIAAAAEPPAQPGEDRGASEEERPSYLSRVWELDRESRLRTSPITPHRGNYILPFTYNATPNDEPFRASEPGRNLTKPEVAFQISFKVKVWEDVLERKMDLWVGYTQRSFWQFYDFEDSSPFRETNYEPELLLNVRTSYDLLGLRGRFVSLGFNHQSNGRAEPLSRSWNRAVANFGFERGDVVLVVHAWYRIPEAEADDDNPDIDRFLGYGQITLYRFRGGHRFGLLLRDNLRVDGNRGALQLDWSFPLVERVSGYLQYFVGYGESLLDYNASSHRAGAGFVLKEW